MILGAPSGAPDINIRGPSAPNKVDIYNPMRTRFYITVRGRRPLTNKYFLRKKYLAQARGLCNRVFLVVCSAH